MKRRNLQIGEHRVRVGKMIAEGGFSFIYAAKSDAGEKLALKVINCQTKDAEKDVKTEIKYLTMLSAFPASISFYGAIMEEKKHKRTYGLLTELCKGGTYVELVNQKPTYKLSEKFILATLARILPPVAALHATRPTPVCHLDLKIENILLKEPIDFKAAALLPSTLRRRHARGARLCDFGSCRTLNIAAPELRRDSALRTRLEAMIQAKTTPAYRAPELADLHSGFHIGPAADVFAIGCLLYKLMFLRAPFGDEASNLAMAAAKWAFPLEASELLDAVSDGAVSPTARQIREIAKRLGRPLDERTGPSYSPRIKQIVRRCLERNPRDRPDVWGLAGLLEEAGHRVRGMPERPADVAVEPPATPLTAPEAVPAEWGDWASPAFEAQFEGDIEFGFFDDGVEGWGEAASPGEPTKPSSAPSSPVSDNANDK
eukprot:gnl/Chilomastix_cuspidata/4102.p1 GENE.gnl/Chilomastix_cuspidata/4102~~gnl/Chilomastix_cuspidata/4102.p1  ORF type:complete len:430 (-),score=87.37 gnl/Chilomastix_cuspidata/4102:72-1361(-)